MCFWLAVAQRALGGNPVPPTFFWTHDGESGQMLMCPGVAPRSTLDQLFAPTESDEVLDLLTPRAEAGATVHAGVASVFRTGEGTVRDLLLAEI